MTDAPLGPELADELRDLGLLLGVLVESGGSVALNHEWLADPFAHDRPSLANAGERVGRLVSALTRTLEPEPEPPRVFDGAGWYSLPGIAVHVAAEGEEEPARLSLCLVAPRDRAAASGQIGVGLLISSQSGNLGVELYAYAPLFVYGPHGTHPIVASSEHPLRLGVRAARVDGHRLGHGDVSFDAMSLGLNAYLDPAAYASTPPEGFAALEFEGLAGTEAPHRYTGLGWVGTEAESWVGAVVGQATSWLNLPLGHTPVRVAHVLVAAGLLEVVKSADPGTEESAYQLTLGPLRSRPPLEIALAMLRGAIDALARDGYALRSLPHGGIYFLRHDNADGTMDYGVRLAFRLPISRGSSDERRGSPAIDLAVGTWLSNEDDETSWLERSSHTEAGDVARPGVTVLLVRSDEYKELSFAPHLALTSVGLDVRASGDTPLVDVAGFTLNGAELRTFLDFGSPLRFGVAGQLNDMGFSLAPRFGSGEGGRGGNPAAQSLLAAGSGGGDPSPVNPTLSLAAGWVSGGSLAVRLFDEAGMPATRVVVPIQRGLGPVMCRSLGIGWQQEDGANELSLLLDGGIVIGPLSVGVTGLSIGVPPATPTDFSRYHFDLDGLGIAFETGDVALSAGFVRVRPDPGAHPPRPYTQYNGMALVKASKFALVGLGSYAYVPDAAAGGGYGSLFLFGVVAAPIGGPPEFQVRGLAGGFGFNRRLILPEPDAVAEFPFVAAAADPGAIGAETQPDGSVRMPDPMVVLGRVARDVPPERGQYWLAAGVRVNSYDLINAALLVVVEFGNEFELALMGTGQISMPPAVTSGTPRVAYAEIGVQAKLLPEHGEFSATAVLTRNSFVLTPACRLTGGLAFYVWFGKSPHAGEFVLTLGGYHPSFEPPAHYPRVPRLGFDWPVGGGVTVSGGAYFALTPSAAMAGGSLRVEYTSGSLSAWLRAEVNALMPWAPLHYELVADVSVGASYRSEVMFVTVTLKVELNAQLRMWGPPTGGEVRVNWYVISFSIAFGDQPTAPPAPLEWRNAAGTGFAQTLLPQPAARRDAIDALAAGDASPPAGGIYTLAVNAGLISTFDVAGAPVWVVRPGSFELSATSAIPSTAIHVGRRTVAAVDVSPAGAGYYVCVRPMKATLSASTLTLTLRADDGRTVDLGEAFDHRPALAPVPAAKWGRPLPGDRAPEPTEMLAGRVLGVEAMRPRQPALSPSGDAALDVDVAHAFGYDTVDSADVRHMPLHDHDGPARRAPRVDGASLDGIHASLMREDVVRVRDAIHRTLWEYGADPGTNGDLSLLAADPAAYLSGAPLVGDPVPA